LLAFLLGFSAVYFSHAAAAADVAVVCKMLQWLIVHASNAPLNMHTITHAHRYTYAFAMVVQRQNVAAAAAPPSVTERQHDAAAATATASMQNVTHMCMSPCTNPFASRRQQGEGCARKQ
jgi:hypothetical protein